MITGGILICLHLVPIFGLSYGNPLGIDLDSSSSSFSPRMASFELEYAGDDREVKGNKDFDVEEGFVVFTPEERRPKLILMGGPLASNFSLSHLAFYWGQSKHTLDGKSYAGELHLVHYNSDTYPGGFAEAAPHPDGIAVMAVLCRQENEKTNAAEGDRLINKLLFTNETVNLEKDLWSPMFSPFEETLSGASYFTYFRGDKGTSRFSSPTWIVLRRPLTIGGGWVLTDGKSAAAHPKQSAKSEREDSPIVYSNFDPNDE